MKRSVFQLIVFLCICLLPTIAEAQQDVSLTFRFVTKNTKEGYDHVSKLIVYSDDEQIGESTEKLQSKPNSVTVKTPKGKHKIKAILYALYNGTWEPRTIANEYSFDFEYSKTGNWEVNNTISLTFDIEQTMVHIKEKVPVVADDED
ncbi:hypothetical protein LK994_11680 [Ferruginibacter lapsinanis]|uniref:hypothetical protein n=1 Tax=Ferruginibacter lapsinanis TaxID=563172 RepID=UPI001E600F4E|nr:hypothetical protein [Ferruginibacter lapsinanis]UEG49292.1 hypothetical protein LK994_11680 [Ferruginibacter lapsinanis]